MKFQLFGCLVLAATLAGGSPIQLGVDLTAPSFLIEKYRVPDANGVMQNGHSRYFIFTPNLSASKVFADSAWLQPKVFGVFNSDVNFQNELDRYYANAGLQLTHKTEAHLFREKLYAGIFREFYTQNLPDPTDYSSLNSETLFKWRFPWLGTQVRYKFRWIAESDTPQHMELKHFAGLKLLFNEKKSWSEDLELGYTINRTQGFSDPRLMGDYDYQGYSFDLTVLGLFWEKWTFLGSASFTPKFYWDPLLPPLSPLPKGTYLTNMFSLGVSLDRQIIPHWEIGILEELDFTRSSLKSRYFSNLVGVSFKWDR